MLRQLSTLALCLFSALMLAADKSPQDLLSSSMRTPLLKTKGTLSGEGVCWHAAYNIDAYQKTFLATKDPAYLDAAAKYFDALIAKMHTSPDGYRGFVGPYIYDAKFICDVHVADAILINPMLGLAELVLVSEHKNRLKHLIPQANVYVALAEKDLIEKWDKRGTWYEDGDHGGYTSWNMYMTADDLTTWRDLKVSKSGLSLPFNKQFDMGLALLRLYRITGKETYHEHAAKIFNFLKRRLTFHDNHYIWSYWEPMTPSDIKNDHEYVHWVNVHPYRNYQAGEIHNIVEAYHCGVTWDKTDIQRFVNTNLKVMWNGDLTNPKWVNSNHAMMKIATGKEPVYKIGNGFKTLAGTAWSALGDFDQTLRELAKQTEASPVSYERKYPSVKSKYFERDMYDNPYVYLAAVIPSFINVGESAQICTGYFKTGTLSIDLYDLSGKKLSTIHEINADETNGGSQIIYNHQWSTQGLKKGTYRVRWTIKNVFREYDIHVQ